MVPLRALARRKPAPDADIERAVQALESEAVRRALSGVAVPVFHQGGECGSTVKHSDQLLMFLLKALRPSRYGGVKESAQTAPSRAFALEIDLSALGSQEAGCPGPEACEEKEECEGKEADEEKGAWEE